MIQALIDSRTEFENLKESEEVITQEKIKDLISRTFEGCFRETGVAYPPPGQSHTVLEFDTFGRLTKHLNFQEFQELSNLEQEMFLELDPFQIPSSDVQYLTCASITVLFEQVKSYLYKIKTENVESITETEVDIFNG
jgi:hypothetical protein